MLNEDGGRKMIIEMSKGRQITIPAGIREALNIGSGSKLEIVKKREGILLKPVGEDIETLFEHAKKIKPKHKLSAKQMDELNERILR